MKEYQGYLGLNSIIENVCGANSSKIYNNCRVINSSLDDRATIGDFSTVRESNIGVRSTIQRNCDIWRLNVGRFTCIGRVSTVQSTIIGSFCALSWNLKIGGDDHDYHMISTHPFWHDTSWGITDDIEYANYYHEKEYEEPCIIGNDVWIGAGVTICRNVNIGNGCVIGGGAVITRDIEPYSVVVGVPGRVIKKRFDDKTIERLEATKWWDLPEQVIRENIDVFKNNHLNEEQLERLEWLCSEQKENINSRSKWWNRKISCRLFL